MNGEFVTTKTVNGDKLILGMFLAVDGFTPLLTGRIGEPFEPAHYALLKFSAAAVQDRSVIMYR